MSTARYKVAVVGTGQLGSRHLQGLAQCRHPLDIYCVDPSPDALAVARQRWEEMGGTAHSVQYLTRIPELPGELFLAIVATNSGGRPAIIRELTAAADIRHLILEKVVFQRPADYDAFDELFRQSGGSVWINCPRRLYPDYQEIREMLEPGTPMQLSVCGNGWGLASNGIHFGDLFSYLSRSAEVRFDTPLVSGISESKRKGYYELNGTLRGEIDGRIPFTISSLASEEPVPMIVGIQTPSMHLQIVEGIETRILRFPDAQHIHRQPHGILYQSQMTFRVLEQLIDSGTCGLPDYASSFRMHRRYVEQFEQIFSPAAGGQTDACPIT